jgi:phosphotransferase system enzyme I (PtsI)
MLFGCSLAPGLAVGNAIIYQGELRYDLEHIEIKRRDVGDEYARVEAARIDVLKDLDETARRVESDLNNEHADIFRAQGDILRDAFFMQEIKNKLERELVGAAETVRHVLARLERHFADAEDPVLQQRAEDIADIARRLLDTLVDAPQRPTLAELPKGSVMVAERLLPSDTVMLSRQSTAAVVIEHGGPLSHAALLTREMGIPAVGQIPQLLDLVSPGSVLLVDGSVGKVVVGPDHSQIQSFESRVHGYQRLMVQVHQHRHELARTQDGVLIHVWANIGTREDAMLAADSGAEGIGLYRIENLYLPREMPPTEDELLEGLQDTLAPVQDQPVTVRLLDVGGDKKPVFLNLPAEPNPSLGRRGVRLLMDYPDLLTTQLRALLRLSRDIELRITIPMVTLIEEVQYVRRALRAAAKKLGIRELPALGVMIETPSAALCTREIAAAADLLSLGTNDLTQYTMVAGREEDSVTDYYIEDHPAVQRLIRMVIEEAENTPIMLCGELAARTDPLKSLVQAGLTSLSVAAPLVPSVKAAIRSIRIE